MRTLETPDVDRNPSPGPNAYSPDTGSLRTPPCIANGNNLSEEVAQGTPKRSSVRDKLIGELANELSPIPSSERFAYMPQQQEFTEVPKYEQDSDDETLKAQSGDESSDSRNASESEAEDSTVVGQDICGSERLSGHTPWIQASLCTGEGSSEGVAHVSPAGTQVSHSSDKDARSWVRQ